MIRCDLVVNIEGEGEDRIVNICPNEAVAFIRSALGDVYAYCEKHSKTRVLTNRSTPITREEYLVHKIMEC